MKYFWSTLSWLWQQKFKAALFVSLTLVWTLLFFPTQKVGELVETLVPKMTGYRSFVFFDRFHLSPTGALYLENVWFSTQGIKAIEVSQVKIQPYLMSLFRGIPRGQLTAVNLFGGTLQAQLTSAQQNQVGLSFSASGMQLEPVLETLGLPVRLVGAIDISALGVADPALQSEPQGELTLSSSGLTLRSSQVPTPLGPLTLPQIRLGQSRAKLQLNQGRLIIEPTQLGSPADDLSAQLSGEIALVMRPQGFQMGAYSLDLDLLAQPAFLQRGGLFLSLLDSYKKTEGDAQRYRFRVSAVQPGVPPSITAR